MMRNATLIVSVIFLLLSLTAVIPFAGAFDSLPNVSASDIISVTKVTVNGEEVYPSGNPVNVEAGKEVNVRVYYTALQDSKDAQMEASVEGVPESRDKTGYFSLSEGRNYSNRLYLDLPEDLEEGDYTIKIYFEYQVEFGPHIFGYDELIKTVDIHVNQPTVPLIPEFEGVIGILTLIMAMVVFFIIRR